MTIDLFASSLYHRCGVFFAPFSDPMAAGNDAMLQSWARLVTYAFPPFALITQVLVRLRGSLGVSLNLIAPFCSQKDWFPDILDLLVEPSLALPLRWDLLRQPHMRRFPQHLPVLRLHAWRLQQLARVSGFSSKVANRLGRARRAS